MSLTQQAIDSLSREWQTVESEGDSYFRRVWAEVEKASASDPYVKHSYLGRQVYTRERERNILTKILIARCGTSA